LYPRVLKEMLRDVHLRYDGLGGDGGGARPHHLTLLIILSILAFAQKDSMLLILVYSVYNCGCFQSILSLGFIFFTLFAPKLHQERRLICGSFTIY
jgi:hypothetical protein